MSTSFPFPCIRHTSAWHDRTERRKLTSSPHWAPRTSVIDISVNAVSRNFQTSNAQQKRRTFEILYRIRRLLKGSPGGAHSTFEPLQKFGLDRGWLNRGPGPNETSVNLSAVLLQQRCSFKQFAMNGMRGRNYSKSSKALSASFLISSSIPSGIMGFPSSFAR